MFEAWLCIGWVRSIDWIECVGPETVFFFLLHLYSAPEVPCIMIIFFFFFLISVFACGYDHGEAMGLRRRPLTAQSGAQMKDICTNRRADPKSVLVGTLKVEL